jgi:nitroreductase
LKNTRQKSRNIKTKKYIFDYTNEPAMDVFEAILNRRSVRKYLDIPVEWDKIGMIMEAARVAPSAGNVQDWRFVVVTKPETRKELASAALSQDWISMAPVHVVVVAMVEKIKRHYGLRGERLYTIQDSAVAATHMMLAAHSLGLATCWIGAFDEGRFHRILNLPEHVRPQILLTLGYPDEKPPMPPRYPIESLVYLEKYTHGSSVGRIKDMGKVLWDFNILGKAMENAKKDAKDLEKVTRTGRKELFDKIKSHCSTISEKLKKNKRDIKV